MVAGAPAELVLTVLNALAQPSAFGDDERSPVALGPNDVAASVRQPPPLGVADGVVPGVLVARGVLFGGVLAGGGAVVVRTGLGGAVWLFSVMLELPLLW